MNNPFFQRIYYQRQLRRAIELEVNFTTLFTVVNRVILYNNRFGTPYIYNPSTAIQESFDEALEVAEDLFQLIHGGVRRNHEIVFESIATINTDLFLVYYQNYTAVHQYLAWSENIWIFTVYTVNYQIWSIVYLAITDTFNLRTEIIRVKQIRRPRR